MSLAALMQKGALRAVATATPATSATETPPKAPLVARVATVAVAIPKSAELPQPPDDDPETAGVMAWLDAIGETDTATVTELRGLLSGDMQARDYFVGRARGFCEPIERPGEFCHSLKGVGEFLESLKEADEPEDDRRTCRECANLTTNLSGEARCMAAWRGQLRDVARNYHPVTNIPRRCDGFEPRTGEGKGSEQ